jgi:ABC-2 type transport system permease protein
MITSVFNETLRRHWRQMLFWGIGIGLLLALVVLIVPDSDSVQRMGELIATLPPVMLQMFGGDDTAFMATPDGFIAFGIFSRLILFLAAYAVVVGLNITSNEEERGIMDMHLSLPIPRWRLVLERLLAYALMTLGVLVIAFAGVAIGLALVPNLPIDLGRLAVAMFASLPVMLVIISGTALIMAWVQSRRIAMGVVILVVVGSYLVDTLGASATDTIMNQLRALTVFNYYDGIAIVRDGLQWGNIVLMLVVAVILAAGALMMYQRREINV